MRSLWAMLMCVALLAAACGDDAAPEVDGAASVASPDGDEPGQSGDRPVDRQATLRFGYAIDVSRLDPHRATIRNDIVTLAPVYDSLIHLDPAGELVPMLATEWDFNDDATVLDLTLREGVTFHDGEPFNAEAVRANIERGKTIDGSTVAPDLAYIAEVEVVDEHHVRFHLTEPNVSIIGFLSDRPGMMISPAAFDEDLDAVAVGAGPFRLIENRPGDVTIYERFDEYWDPDAALVQHLEVSVVPQEVTRLNGLRSDQFDAAILGPAQHAEAQALEGITVLSEPTMFFIHLSFNRARSELGDVNVRKAIYHGIDREGICQGLMFGLCDVSVQPFPDGYWAAHPDLPSDHYAYDPERSRELLAEAGLPNGFSFSLMIPAGLATYTEAAEAIKSQLAEVGIDVTLVAMDPAQMADRMYAQKAEDAIIGGLSGSADPSLYFAQRIIGSAYANPAGTSTPEMEELFKKSISTPDPDEREAILHDAVFEVVDEVLNINVLFPHTITGLRDDVVGYVTPLSGNPQFRGVGIAAD